MRTYSDSRPQWLDILIKVLSFILSLLSGFGGALVLAPSSAGLRAQGLDPTSKWFLILLGCSVVLAVAVWVFRMWLERREETENELLEKVLDYVESVLDALKEETNKRLREIPQAAVEGAARQVYQTFIADTALALVPEDVFVQFVVERWRQLAGVQTNVKVAIARV